LVAVGDSQGHFSCPFCNSYDVSRLFVASLRSDTCECLTCGARWDEDASSGAYRGRGNRSSVLYPQSPSARDD
jgi:hypothetical protein